MSTQSQTNQEPCSSQQLIISLRLAASPEVYLKSLKHLYYAFVHCDVTAELDPAVRIEVFDCVESLEAFFEGMEKV